LDVMLKLKKLESYGSGESHGPGPQPSRANVLHEANRILATSLDRWPHEPDLHNWAGKFFGYRGDYLNAAFAYDRASRLNPQNLEYRLNRAVAWYRSLPRGPRLPDDGRLRAASEACLSFIEETHARVLPYTREEGGDDIPGYAPGSWLGLLTEMGGDLRGRLEPAGERIGAA